MDEVTKILDDEKELSDDEKLAKKALALLKEINDDKVAEINGREYELLKLTHKKRRKVAAYYSSVEALIKVGNFSFIGHNNFDNIETILFENVKFENGTLSDEHFENDKYINDYFLFVVTFLGAFSYPFFPESLID